MARYKRLILSLLKTNCQDQELLLNLQTHSSPSNLFNNLIDTAINISDEIIQQEQPSLTEKGMSSDDRVTTLSSISKGIWDSIVSLFEK